MSRSLGEHKRVYSNSRPRKKLVVGTSRFELLTCRLGGGCSIHLSYVPVVLL